MLDGYRQLLLNVVTKRFINVVRRLIVKRSKEKTILTFKMLQ